MWLTALSLARKAAKRNQSNNAATPTTPSARRRRPKSGTLLAILAVLITATALILSILCVFAGHKPAMMPEYAVFTLNTSRIGEHWRQELDSKIMSVHLKRSVVVLPTVTAAPTTLVTNAPRNIISNIDSHAHSIISKASKKGHSEVSHAESAAKSETSAIASKASSAVGAAETDLVNVVNKAYDGIVSDLDLKDFYAVHLMTTCFGEYVLRNGSNITVGQSGLPDKGTHEHVDACEQHSAIDPMSLIRVIYWIGIVCTGIALVLGVAGTIRSTRKMALLNVVGTLPAFLVLGLSSAVTHGIALGAEKLIDFVGEDIGIAGYKGDEFLALTWTTTALLLIDTILWSLLFVLRGRASRDLDRGQGSPAMLGNGRGTSWRSRSRPDRTSEIALGPVKPMPVRDKYGNQML